ncbi:type VI secretion system baseplate subunit TssE [Bradyrhizobium jicamae]|uniref:Type VI secretion system baseplate subunit TssE n=2 Tax=Bradyrhizobium jicamae TaxID=280332 RepID=A0ABS5FVB6_9BRAD|nr:type VI secretion system baseplate subunit TssE [Bradyrhizobium jicamae]MBR0936605.1 type VI secretion system baseplate subunit TssE [Bradyrhizobium jicamae]
MHVFRAAHAAKDAQKQVDIRDEAGERVIASRRMRVRQVISEPMLRREVTLDLDALLNTIALESTIDDIREAEYVRKSILNFGLPDVTHRTIDEVGVGDISEEIKTAIVKYEPRLAAASIRVERDMSVDPVELKIRFIVRADLTCDPVNAPVEFTADMVDGGKILINRR